MEIASAVALGFVQAVTEFLPISSSAHLIILPWIAGWKPQGIVFDVAVHLGTSIAILTYFWKDWWVLAREFVRGIGSRRILDNPQRRLAVYLIVGTLPAAFFGLLFEDVIGAVLRSPLITVATLTSFGVLLYYADLRGARDRSLEQLNWGDCLWIGLFQTLALVPGVSRSGITISVGLIRNLQRVAAARYSFLLSTPVIVGAAVLQTARLARVYLSPPGNAATIEPIAWEALLVGTTISAVVGFLCIRYFLLYLQRHSFLPFVVYRFLLAGLVFWFHLHR